MKKHEILPNIRIEKLIFWGSGLAIAPDGRKIIISGWAIPEAIADIRITKVKKTHFEWQIVRTVKKSPLEKPIPPEWQLYGGCKWLPIPYQKQLEIKQVQIFEAFHSLRDATKESVFHPIIPSPESEHYRNKVEFSWGKYISAREGIHEEYRFGFHIQGQFDRIEDCWYCVLASDTVNAIFRDIDIMARESDFPTYDPKTNQGFWRHLVIREWKKTGEIMVIFSINTLWDENSEVVHLFTQITQNLTKKYPNITSLYILENTGKADIVQGRAILISWKEFITDELLWLSFEIQPKSFFQVNTLGAEKLYTQAISYIRHTWWVLLDLYAGTGTIGILLSQKFQKVYSVELVESSSQDGLKNAKRNGVSNVEFIQAKVEDFAADFAKNGGKADTIVLDPPRDGLHPSAISHILGFWAKEIIYVSCNPGTLVRDLEKLLFVTAESGEKTSTQYSITDVTPVDMFPHTHHIETVVRLEKAS